MGLFNLFGKKEEQLLSQLPQINPPISQNQVQLGSFPEREIPSVLKELEGTPDKAPFFVRIDKFNEFRDNLRLITKRLKEMDHVLEKIHEIDLKEGEEIAAWKEEMKKIRENLAKIDEDIFNKI